MKFEVFKDQAGEWRWRLRADNGRIVADSAEGYANQRDVEIMLASIQLAALGAKIVYLGQP
jgi:uncharacterized protein YegP (UPF0339 family)